MEVCWERWNRRKNIMTGEVDYLEPHGDGKASTILVVSDQEKQ